MSSTLKPSVPTRVRLPVSESSLMYAPPQSIPSWKFTSYLHGHHRRARYFIILFYLTWRGTGRLHHTRQNSLNNQRLVFEDKRSG